MSIPHRIQRLLDGAQLQEVTATDEDVSALWEKAVASARDARILASSPDNQYVLGYQALLQMGTAILGAAGYRTRGSQGHHANTFYAVAALGIAGLGEIDIRTERIRKMRKLSAYEPGSPTPEQLDHLRELLDATLPAARDWLTTKRPDASLAVLPTG
ncbi:MAG TPA: hypothetical protein VE913_09350 [Longimicrobium sp.]|nr:hypothetical protein [Longimicrobium sp.]